MSLTMRLGTHRGACNAGRRSVWLVCSRRSVASGWENRGSLPGQSSGGGGDDRQKLEMPRFWHVQRRRGRTYDYSKGSIAGCSGWMAKESAGKSVYTRCGDR